MKTFAVAFLMWCLFAGVTAMPKEVQRVAVLLIANDRYIAPIPNLATPASDVNALARTLSALGADVTIRVDLDRAATHRALADFELHSRGADVALVYYAGHGVQWNGVNWIVPVDARLGASQDVVSQAVPFSALVAATAGARTRALLFDACRDAPFESTTRGLANMEVDDSLIVFSASAGAVAADGVQSSPFAVSVRKHIGTAGVDARTVASRIRADVIEATQGAQRPYVMAYLAGVSRPLFAMPAPAQGPAESSEERKAWSATLRAANLAGFQQYLSSYPQGAHKETAERLAGLHRDFWRGGRAFKNGPRIVSVADGANLRAGDAFRDCDACPTMIVLPAGSFLMGASENDSQALVHERPQRRVVISPMAVSQSEISVVEYGAFANDGELSVAGPAGPVVSVSWERANAYAQQLSRLTGRRYRLLSEAEWEYAARAGAIGPYWGGTIDPSGANVVSGPMGGRLAPPGETSENRFGLRDTIGNAAEWVMDCYSTSLPAALPRGEAYFETDCPTRVVRGGDAVSGERDVRLSSRRARPPNTKDHYLGFRLARELP